MSASPHLLTARSWRSRRSAAIAGIIFAVLLLGFTLVTHLSWSSKLRTAAMALLGMLLGTVGIDPISGVARFTFGTLTLNDGRRFDVDGWRGSYEHSWGDILPGDVEWDYLDSAIVHGKPGQAWVARGLNRTDTVTGPGARDAQWLGLIARVNRGHIKICRPRIDRRGWLFTYPDFAMWDTRLRARCGGISICLRDRRETAIDEFVDRLEVRARTRTRTGLVTHISHPKR